MTIYKNHNRLCTVNFRSYGKTPFSTAVMHGGPGAGGEMAPVAQELSKHRGVLEPIQTAQTLEGQVEELRDILQHHGDTPVVLIGHSWGAWLCFIVAAGYPALVKKLILVASGPFEEKYVTALQETRLSRLDDRQNEEFISVNAALGNPAIRHKNALLKRLGILAAITDSYDPIDCDPVRMRDTDREIYANVWHTAAQWRRSGKLLAFGQHIHCPVVAIHGDYDPHPAAGVKQPLEGVLPDFQFILLEKCGHYPWQERQAREKFYQILEKEIKKALDDVTFTIQSDTDYENF